MSPEQEEQFRRKSNEARRLLFEMTMSRFQFPFKKEDLLRKVV